MRLKKVVGFMLTLSLVASLPITSFVSKASELTQASSADNVVYGSITPSEAAIVESIFDYDYYKKNNPELVSVIGDRYSDLLKHFLLCGIFEGRTCNANFNPSAYASAYSDLKDKYGVDIVKYYIHYVEFGKDDGRTITTLEACAEAGITVEGLVGENVKISPAVYRLAINMGTTDFVQLQNAINQIIAGEQEQKSSSSTESSSNNENGDNSSITIETETGIYELRIGGGDTEAYAKAKGLTKIDGVTLSGNNFVTLYLIKGIKGHAVTKNDHGVNTVVYHTSDYIVNENGNNTEGSISLSVPPKEDKVPSPVNTYDKTNYPYFESKDNVVTTTDQPANEIVSYVGITSPIYVTDDNTSRTATDYYLNDRVSTLKGYYTDSEGNEVHEFLSEEDFLSWDASNPLGSGFFTLEPTVNYEFYGKDVDGNSNTVYEVGIDIKSNEDGTLKEVTVGVYNDENEFGYLSTTTVPEQNANN